MSLSGLEDFRPTSIYTARPVSELRRRVRQLENDAGDRVESTLDERDLDDVKRRFKSAYFLSWLTPTGCTGAR